MTKERVGVVVPETTKELYIWDKWLRWVRAWAWQSLLITIRRQQIEEENRRARERREREERERREKERKNK